MLCSYIIQLCALWYNVAFVPLSGNFRTAGLFWPVKRKLPFVLVALTLSGRGRRVKRAGCAVIKPYNPYKPYTFLKAPKSLILCGFPQKAGDKISRVRGQDFAPLGTKLRTFGDKISRLSLFCGSYEKLSPLKADLYAVAGVLKARNMPARHVMR